MAVQALRTPWPDVLGYRIEMMKRIDAKQAFRSWDRPVLYLRAEDDHFVGAASVREISTLNPATQVVSVPGPHLLLAGNPTGAAQQVGRFLDELQKKDHPRKAA